jgi:hypothetical protein
MKGGGSLGLSSAHLIKICRNKKQQNKRLAKPARLQRKKLQQKILNYGGNIHEKLKIFF